MDLGTDKRRNAEALNQRYVGYNKDMKKNEATKIERTEIREGAPKGVSYIPQLTDEQIKQAFGNSLKELRAHLGITQVALEEATQIPRQSLSVYERGEILPTISQAYKITRFFRLSIEDFIIYGANEQRNVLQENFRDITEKYDSVVKI